MWMSLTTNVIYSGLIAQNSQRLKDIQRAESAVSSYYNSLGGVTERNSHWHVADNGVSYEKTISDSVSAGLSFIQDLDKQISGTKFFVGTVSYGQTYGNSSDIYFVVNPDLLSKLGTDEATRKQFEEDVNYLNQFARSFREQQLSQGREIISQGWFCDENGYWGGWTVSRPINQSSVLQEMTDYAEKIRQEKLEERKKAEAEDTSEKESETISGSIGVNVGKTARKIAVAKTRAQLQAVIAEIEGDMQEVKDGIDKGWCDESEMDKVKLLMYMAQNRMGQVEDREATPEEENMFAMASLM